MYNGIGLVTPRGSGTNGYVQRNLSMIHMTKDKTSLRTEADIIKADAESQRGPNQEILEHARKRALELKCAEMEDVMKEQGYCDEEVEKKVIQYRAMLMESEHTNRPAVQLNPFGHATVRETHAVAELQQQKNARLKEAFGISEYFVDGSSLDPDRKAKEEVARHNASLHQEEKTKKKKRKYEWVKTPSPSPDRSSSSKKEKKDKKKKKKHSRERSSSHDSRKRRKSKKKKRSRSSTPKKKRSNREKKKESNKKKKRASAFSGSSLSSNDNETNPADDTIKSPLRDVTSEDVVCSSKETKLMEKHNNPIERKDDQGLRRWPGNNQETWKIQFKTKGWRRNKLEPSKLSEDNQGLSRPVDLQEQSEPGIKHDAVRISLREPVIAATCYPNIAANVIQKGPLVVSEWNPPVSSDASNNVNNLPTHVVSSEPATTCSISEERTNQEISTNATSVQARPLSPPTSGLLNHVLAQESPVLAKQSSLGLQSLTFSNGNENTDTSLTKFKFQAGPFNSTVKRNLFNFSSRIRRPSFSPASDISSSGSSRSRSRSRSSSRHRSRSRRSSRSRSFTKSKSRSLSRSRSPSKRSHSSSRSRSKFGSRSRSRSHKSGSRSRYSRSFSRSLSRSRSSISGSRSRSTSRSKSRSVSTSKSRSRSSGRSRSPSIPRRKGSPSFLDKRRITSARKRPVPYHRPTPPASSSSSDSSFWSRSPSRSRSRSWSMTMSPS